MLRQRLLSAAILAPIVVLIFLAGDPWLTVGVAVLALVAAHETFRLLALAGLPGERAIGLVAAPVAVLGMPFMGHRAGVIAAFVASVIIVSAIAAFRRRQARDGFLAWVGTSFGALYISLLAFLPATAAAAPAIAPGAPFEGFLDAGPVWLLVLVLTVWSFDTFAYLAGRTLKRGRFLDHISPSKTWSGVIGGTVAAVVVCALLVAATGQHVAGGMALGLLIAVTAQAGDVAESLLKRAAGAKDSGTLIPGHGGILDRVDSFLFAAPAMYAGLTLIQLLAAGGPA
ncbi:MAG: phosphatidate cytidylyltransferase [Chloroflexota bacterium]|nr:phosphatidate cytidylyltransferase [Chloroflexota bacterium]